MRHFISPVLFYHCTCWCIHHKLKDIFTNSKVVGKHRRGGIEKRKALSEEKGDLHILDCGKLV